MDDNENNAPETPAMGEHAESAASSGDSPGFVTSEQLQDFGRDLMGNFRKTMAGMINTQKTPLPTQTKTDASSQPAVDVASLIRQERTMERAMAKHGLNETQGEIVRQLMDTQRPEDASAFIANFAQTMGIVSGSPAQATPTTTAPNPNPASDGGTPGMTPTLESDDQPVWKWSDDKVAKFVKEKGHREFANLMKQRLPRDLQGVRFKLPRS